MLALAEGQLPDAGNREVMRAVEPGHGTVQVQIPLSVHGELIGTVVRNVDALPKGVVDRKRQARREAALQLSLHGIEVAGADGPKFQSLRIPTPFREQWLAVRARSNDLAGIQV